MSAIRENLHFPTRRTVLNRMLAMAAASASPAGLGRAAAQGSDVTFLFASDVHACRIGDGLSPHCAEEGKTDENLRRHIAALNRLPEMRWPEAIGGRPTGLFSAGERIAIPRGLVIGGDMTDDGGGQVAQPGEGRQLLQFSQRSQEGHGPDRIHFPVYVGMGNHDLDQDGPPPHVDWYRRELRDYVEMNHRPSVIFKPSVPAGNYDLESDDYSWDWDGVHLVQAHRFAGDRTKGAADGLPWLRQDLAANAADGRPVELFQHYGWDEFSLERWDPSRTTFDDEGGGAPHWWTEADRQALLSAISGYNVVGIFHGHEHPTPMIYSHAGLDIFKPKASFMGGFALVRIAASRMDVVLGEASGHRGEVVFTNAFSKPVSLRKP